MHLACLHPMRTRANTASDFLQGHNESLRETNDKLFDLLESERARVEQLVGTLDKAIETLRQTQEELRKVREFTPLQPQMVANAPLFMGEQEEDLQWQVKNGIINQEELEEILKQAGIENTEIEFG